MDKLALEHFVIMGLNKFKRLHHVLEDYEILDDGDCEGMRIVILNCARCSTAFTYDDECFHVLGAPSWMNPRSEEAGELFCDGNCTPDPKRPLG